MQDNLEGIFVLFITEIEKNYPKALNPSYNV